jgi:glycerol kinase
LIEPPYGDETASDADRFARETARRLAFDDPGPDEFVARIAAAVTALTLPQDQSITVSGGGAGSPHLAKLLARQLPLTAVFCRESETTLLGAARLAAAGARIGWGGAPGGGASPRLEV